jgi:hypothetical protein
MEKGRIYPAQPGKKSTILRRGTAKIRIPHPKWREDSQLIKLCSSLGASYNVRLTKECH